MNISVKWYLILWICFGVIDVNCQAFSSGLRYPYEVPRRSGYRRVIPCPLALIKNGYSAKVRDVLSFYCILGFKLLGKTRILCKDGRFDNEIPICGKPGCNATITRPNGTVQLLKSEMVLKLSCQSGFDLAGSGTAYCDGREWDRQLGECRPVVSHSKVCDFETADLCGWTQDSHENDFSWFRRNGWNVIGRLRFGPKHDHTSGKPLHGYYMVAESTNAQYEQVSRLWSPIHTRSDSQNACFRFFYHMCGAYVGRLRVLVKPIAVDIDAVSNDTNYIYFENRYSSNEWYEGFFSIRKLDSDFQIIFEATVPKGRISDIAIDDVALLKGAECGGDSTTTTESAVEETDGIYDIQSCANRCNETESEFLNGLAKYVENGQYIEKCDCHPDCESLTTCCLDYQMSCGQTEDYATESIGGGIKSNASSPIVDFGPSNGSKAVTSVSPTKISSTTELPTNSTSEVRSIETSSTRSVVAKFQKSSNSGLSSDTDMNVWIIGLCVVSLSAFILAIAAWGIRRVNKRGEPSHRIVYKPNATKDDSVDFNAEEDSRHSIDENADDEHAQLTGAPTGSVYIRGHSRADISTRVKQQFRRSQRFMSHNSKH